MESGVVGLEKREIPKRLVGASRNMPVAPGVARASPDPSMTASKRQNGALLLDCYLKLSLTKCKEQPPDKPTNTTNKKFILFLFQ